MTKSICSLEVHQTLVFGTLRELRRALNRMRMAMRYCPGCTGRGEECPLMGQFRENLSAALHVIYEEWELE